MSSGNNDPAQPRAAPLCDPALMKLLSWRVLALLPAALAGAFTITGPGGGGAMFNPTVSPLDPQTALVSCDMTGAYITHDGGASWRMFNLRGTVRFFAFDPANPAVMYAQTSGLWRSTDAGRSWRLLYPDPAAVQRVFMDLDHADEHIAADPNPLGTITALAIDPADSRTLYAAAREGAANALFVSHDFARTWKRTSGLPEPVTKAWIHAGVIYAAGAAALHVLKEGTWEHSVYPAGVRFKDLSAGFAATAVLYGAADQGLFVSADGGISWRDCRLPGSGARIRAVATSLHHPDVAYASYRGLALEGSSWFGVAKTTDSGETWQLVWKEKNNAPAANVHDAWITKRFGPGWGENPLMLGVSPTDPNLCYATDFGRTMRTSDGGANWTAVYSKPLNGGYTTTGLDVTTNYGVHFDPFDHKRLFISYTDIGLFRSEDGGKSWVSSTDGVPREWVNTTYWVEFDPKVRGRMWAVMTGTHDLPRPKMWRHASVLTYRGGVCRSDDGGRTWYVSNEGMQPTAPTHVLLDPDSPVDRRVLYVAAFGRGVYKSVDNGRTWRLKNEGITQQEPFAWRLARGADPALYLVIARRSENGSIGTPGDGALYISTDGAEHWTPLPLPAGVNAPNGLAVDPRDPKRLYLAAWTRTGGSPGEGGGIWVSTDRGRSWRPLFTAGQHIYDVTIDPRDPGVLYACGFESAAWRSSDRGEHWSRIPGFNFKWGHRVIPDPDDASQVYITTFGGSVWHGPSYSQGAHDAVDLVDRIVDVR